MHNRFSLDFANCWSEVEAHYPYCTPDCPEFDTISHTTVPDRPFHWHHTHTHTHPSTGLNPIFPAALSSSYSNLSHQDLLHLRQVCPRWWGPCFSSFIYCPLVTYSRYTRCTSIAIYYVLCTAMNYPCTVVLQVFQENNLFHHSL